MLEARKIADRLSVPMTDALLSCNPLDRLDRVAYGRKQTVGALRTRGLIDEQGLWTFLGREVAAIMSLRRIIARRVQDRCTCGAARGLGTHDCETVARIS